MPRREQREQWEVEVDALFSTPDARELLTMAQGYWAYYVACRKSGFSNEQAMALVVAMQTTFLEEAQRANRQKGEQDG